MAAHGADPARQQGKDRFVRRQRFMGIRRKGANTGQQSLAEGARRRGVESSAPSQISYGRMVW